jgi:peptide/nickel transport system permease protein
MSTLLRNQSVIIGGTVIVVLLAAAVLAPVLAPYDPLAFAPTGAMQPPNAQHWFGTDQFGRDLLSRVLYGSRISLTVGLVAVVISSILGTVIGIASGFFGNTTDLVIMRIIDLMLAFPGILLALVIVSILGPGLLNAMLAVGIYGIPSYARVVRGSTLQVKESLFVEAARSIGAGRFFVMRRHILPNVFAPIIVMSTLRVAGAILTAAALSFLGLGAQPPTPEWGALVSAGRDWVRNAWWLSTFPGLAIMVAVLAINMFGDGLRDVLDPRLKR